MKKTKISIIIPIYNADKYLRECLDSITNQTLDDIEIICVNDGSKDKSLEIIKEYKNKFKNIIIIDQKNSGVIAARIAGYKAATGEYIGWVDADDFIDKKMFEKLYKSAKKCNADVAYCNYNFYPKEVVNKQKWFNEYSGKVTWNFIMNNTIQWNKIVKKELLDKLDITKLFETIGEGCYGIVLINAKSIISIDECLYNYRVGHASLSSGFKNIKWYKTVVERSLNMLSYVKDNNYDNEWINFYEYRYLYYNLILMIVSAYSNNKKTYIDSKKILVDKKMFSNKYKEYLTKSFSKFKLFFIKLGFRSYLLMKIMSKIVL